MDAREMDCGGSGDTFWGCGVVGVLKDSFIVL
jgi:hypothetical protein